MYKSFVDIHQEMSTHGKVFLFMGQGVHKIKKKAEQVACEIALSSIKDF